ncbi:RING-H2 finger protein ATL16, partial [Cucurbita argyrosperma subsp. sororia]
MELFPQLKSSHYLPPFPPPIPSHSDSTSFPIIAIAIIGILATAFLLLSYYVFVINCCLNWHRIDLLRRLSLSSRRRRPTAHHSFSTHSHKGSTLFHRFPLPTSSPADPIGGGNERDFVVIELGGIRNDPSGQLSQERPNSGECPATTGKLEQGKKRRKLQKVTSLGDEWIDTREKDERFCVQPIRRSVSMDSSAERQMYLAVQAALRGSTASPGGDGCHGRGRRSLFSFGNGMSCRNGVEVQAVRLEES